MQRKCIFGLVALIFAGQATVTNGGYSPEYPGLKDDVAFFSKEAKAKVESQFRQLHEIGYTTVLVETAKAPIPGSSVRQRVKELRRAGYDCLIYVLICPNSKGPFVEVAVSNYQSANGPITEEKRKELETEFAQVMKDQAKADQLLLDMPKFIDNAIREYNASLPQKPSLTEPSAFMIFLQYVLGGLLLSLPLLGCVCACRAYAKRVARKRRLRQLVGDVSPLPEIAANSGNP